MMKMISIWTAQKFNTKENVHRFSKHTLGFTLLGKCTLPTSPQLYSTDCSQGETGNVAEAYSDQSVSPTPLSQAREGKTADENISTKEDATSIISNEGLNSCTSTFTMMVIN